MKRVLIISYFFPPCNLTASERVSSWAKHLNKFGYYPVVITRRWDHKIKTLADTSLATPNDSVHEKNENFEVYYLPYIPNLRDRIYTKYGNKLGIFRRLLSLMELALQNYFDYFIPYNNFHQFAQQFLTENSDIKLLIISGNPYIQFKFGYKLSKKFNLKWIADYRDAWTTSEIDGISKGIIFKHLRKNDMKFEKKWVGSASYITSVSEPLMNGISNFTGVQGKWISNGFEIGEFDNYKHLESYPTFTITYVGTLYHGQHIELFCDAFKKLIDHNPGINTKLLFPGLAYHKEQASRISTAMKGYEKHFECTERTNKEKILEIEARSHLLLYPAWKGYKGIIASKIYEYINSGTYTIVTPSDDGEIEKIITKSGCGICTNNIEDTLKILNQAYLLFLEGKKIQSNLNGENTHYFSREYQTKLLSDILNNLQ
jgi:glycosyltransferase involved in cell wall biosynthesis